MHIFGNALWSLESNEKRWQTKQRIMTTKDSMVGEWGDAQCAALKDG